MSCGENQRFLKTYDTEDKSYQSYQNLCSTKKYQRYEKSSYFYKYLLGRKNSHKQLD